VYQIGTRLVTGKFTSIRIIVPGRPWGPNNLAGRLASQILLPELGQPVLVEHRRGAAGASLYQG
jgi:tripartite-type tricarboxylate transporter receptor subunit TctC